MTSSLKLAGALVVMVLMACRPEGTSGSPRPTLSSAPTPVAASPQPGEAIRAPAPPGCTARVTDAAGGGPVFVALADLGDRGVAFLLDATTGVTRGRIDIGGSPEVAVDWAGNQLLTFCSDGLAWQLVAYDLATLRERWRTRFEDRQMTKAPGGVPALAVSSDGRLVFAMHYKVLRPGDANAPGASRRWLTAHDARDGSARADVELPDCGVGRLLTARDVAYVMCADGVRRIEPATWRVAATYPMAWVVGPAALVGGRIYGVSRESRVTALDLGTGVVTELKSWADRPWVNAFGTLAIAADAQTVAVLAKAAGEANEFEPDTLTTFDLKAGARTDLPVTGIRGVGIVGPRVVYFANGRMRSTDGALDLRLLSERVDFWHVLSR